MEVNETIKKVKKSIMKNDYDTLKKLFGQNPQMLSYNSIVFGTWLHYAANEGMIEAVKCLIDLGLNVNAIGGAFEGTPICDAASEGHAEVIEVLMAKGAKPDIVSGKKDGNPLRCAIGGVYLRVVDILITKGGKLFDETQDQNDALALATRNGQLEIAARLIREMKNDEKGSHNEEMTDKQKVKEVNGGEKFAVKNNVWMLFYNGNKKRRQFAELISIDHEIILSKGDALTLGAERKVNSIELTCIELENMGFKQAREWSYQPNKVSFNDFEKELLSAICSGNKDKKQNAIAIISDADAMTIAVVRRKFNLKATLDESLWVVDEWGEWEEDVELDPSYRWMLAYGYRNQNRKDFFTNEIITRMCNVLEKMPEHFLIRLIYIPGSEAGYQLSARCMGNAMSKRMMNWLRSC